jgi:hypothetical protein
LPSLNLLLLVTVVCVSNMSIASSMIAGLLSYM